MLAAGDYEKDINTVNPLGMKGALATAFAQMISALWSGAYQSFPPTKIKVNNVNLLLLCVCVLLSCCLNQGSDTRIILKKPRGFFCVKPIEKKQRKPAPNYIQFQFVVPVVIKDFFMYRASNDQ